MRRNTDVQAVITGMAQLGEIYLRIAAKIRSFYEENPKLRFEANTLMTRAGYETENFDLQNLIDQLLQKSPSVQVPKEERKFLLQYARMYNDPVLTEEVVREYLAADAQGRGQLKARMEEQLLVFPDPKLGLEELDRFGYHGQDLFPVRREIALEITAHTQISVYGIYEDNRKELLKDRKSIEAHKGMFGVKRDAWINSYLEAFREGRELHFDFQEPEKEYRIYQWKKDAEDRREYSFMPYDVLVSMGVEINVSHYDLIYENRIRKSATLDDIFEIFNLDHPNDFKGHSLSVGDVVAFLENGKWNAFYVDSFGFQQLEDFERNRQEHLQQEKDAEKLPEQSKSKRNR